ncbi:STAS domain-containing protein [Amycolatopsis sp. K13G38]|uniref:Anti-sigma factor antagonist n=1 Tax=Amycolatopsis acididurans TaxID=2724524 RepID=A0ABX1J2B5_9PSEU|nr:STAS domain-containing protein [Amycolatopsis acididurans]NKQ53916.1 STAS domain-containing protein [Amycolatopsis acididurans]
MVAEPDSFVLGARWPKPDVAILEVTGDLDIRTAPQLEAALSKLCAEDPRTVVVDLTAVGFLGSAGLAALIAVRQRTSSPKALRIVAATEETDRMFRLTGLDGLLAVYPTRDAALSDV